ncbi:MAG: glycosyltransferase family 2 protein [Armatimonadota bacterium]
MRLSVIIVNWNTTQLLIECLQSLKLHPPTVNYEIIVVDNASADFRPCEFTQRFPKVRLICNSENLGYAVANNQAIRESRGEYILLLNPDTQVTDKALDALLEFMDLHPQAAACGAKLVRPDGTVELSVRGFPYPTSLFFEFIGLSRIFPNSRTIGRYRMRWFSYNETSEVDQPMGSCLILRRRAVEEVGLLDESFPIFFNEVDWLYRAKKIGWKIYFTPEAIVVHHGGAATSQVARRVMIRESHNSLIRFYEKHFKQQMPGILYWLLVALIRIATLLRR